MAIELKRNKKTGFVEAWENGKKVGKITTMGDETKDGKVQLRNRDGQHRGSSGRTRRGN